MSKGNAHGMLMAMTMEADRFSVSRAVNSVKSPAIYIAFIRLRFSWCFEDEASVYDTLSSQGWVPDCSALP